MKKISLMALLAFCAVSSTATFAKDKKCSSESTKDLCEKKKSCVWKNDKCAHEHEKK